MPNQTAAQPRSLARLTFLLDFDLASMLSSGCGLFGTHKKVQVPQLLTPLAEADTARLISEVNRLAAVRSIHGKVDIVFEDTSFAEVRHCGKIQTGGRTDYGAKTRQYLPDNSSSVHRQRYRADDFKRRIVSRGGIARRGEVSSVCERNEQRDL